MSEIAPPALRCVACDAVLLPDEATTPSGDRIAAATARHYAEQHGSASVPAQRVPRRSDAYA